MNNRYKSEENLNNYQNKNDKKQSQISFNNESCLSKEDHNDNSILEISMNLMPKKNSTDIFGMYQSYDYFKIKSDNSIRDSEQICTFMNKSHSERRHNPYKRLSNSLLTDRDPKYVFENDKSLIRKLTSSFHLVSNKPYNILTKK